MAIKTKIDKAQKTNLDRVNPSRQNTRQNSHAKYIPVLDGKVLVWEQDSTNLSEFSSRIDSTDRMLELFLQSNMGKLLEVDINHAQNMLDELTLRTG